VATRFYPARASSAGLVTEAHEEHVTLAIFRSTQNLESQITFVMMSNDKKYCN
jgi:hypothetical protein